MLTEFKSVGHELFRMKRKVAFVPFCPPSLRFFLTRVRARTLQQFCTFCFHNLHRNPCKVLKDYTLRGIFRVWITLFHKNRRKVVEKCIKNGKKWQESFPKRVRPTEKTYEKYGKISDIFWKNSNVFQEISYVFSETSEILSSGCEVWRLWKQKVQNPREGARVTRVREN